MAEGPVALEDDLEEVLGRKLLGHQVASGLGFWILEPQEAKQRRKRGCLKAP